MAELTALEAETHGDLRIDPQAVLELASRQHIFNLRANEIGKACSSFPIFVTRDPETGDLAFSAMSAFEPNSNLFISDGKWDAVYMPAAMQTYPLFLMQAPGSEKGHAVGVDETAAGLSREQGDRLFDDKGKATPMLTRLSGLLDADIRHNLQTREFLRRIEALDLITSVDLKIEYRNGQVNTITGLNSINETKLTELTGETLQEFHQKGYLLALHALLVSSFQLNGMIQRQETGDQAVTAVRLEVSKSLGTN